MGLGFRVRTLRVGVVACAGVLLCASLATAGGANASATTTSAPAKTSRSHMLYVGSFHNVTTPPSSTFSTIQAAVDSSKPGDWILIAPGDYHEVGDTGTKAPSPSDLADGWYGGVDVTTPRVHLRGMNRNSVVVDGTLATATTPCSSAPADQNSLNGDGRNGVLVWKANGVSVDNLTVCNFIGGSGNGGNEIWWNGGAGSGSIGLRGYSGSYLTATSTYFAGSDPSHLNVCGTCALYGIISSDSTAPSPMSQL